MRKAALNKTTAPAAKPPATGTPHQHRNRRKQIRGNPSKAFPEKTIDVWFTEQDAAVEAESKNMARRHQRQARKFDYSEAQRRIDERVRKEQEQFALELAITRAGWKYFGTRAVDIDAGDDSAEIRSQMVAAYNRMFPGKSILEHDITRRVSKNNPNSRGVTRFDSDELCSEHELAVRAEVVAEMRRELECRKSEPESLRRVK